MKSSKRNLLRKLKDRQVLIWGARMTGIGFLRFAKMHNIPIIGFVDSDTSLHGMMINNNLIHKPESILSLRSQYDNLIVLVAVALKEDEIIESMKDLRSVGVKILTLGQYLQPSKKHLPVVEFIPPEKFTYFKEVGLSLGFEHVESSPLVRSSYHAEKHIK